MSTMAPPLLCPVCSMQTDRRPDLSPMIAIHILVAPVDPTEREHEKPPYFSYRCGGCGFGEIHRRGPG